MGAFLGISLWVALATVVPGLVTIAVVSLAVSLAHPAYLPELELFVLENDWVLAGAAITVMVLTQAAGILLEEMIIKLRLFPGCTRLEVPVKFDSTDHTTINGYQQYENLYILLAQLDEHEDSQGHLKRAAAQYFLTNNTLVSFLVGIAAAVYFQSHHYYIYGLFICFLLSSWVAAIRFRVMAKTIWAAQTARELRHTEQVNA